MITGSAGFIGFHLARRLLAAGHEVAGVDGMTPYYDVQLKLARHAILRAYAGFTEHQLMIEDAGALNAAASRAAPEIIVHLAAQAGVRYSLENPRAYVDSNLVGVFNIMEVARRTAVRHLMFASTSSVYGANASVPFRENDRADHPLTLYAATKKAGEEMTHAYSHLWSIPTTAFRFFTIYGPWGRPDMALFKFVDRITQGRPIEVFNQGRLERDFTYIDDLVESLWRLLELPPRKGAPVAGAIDSLSPAAPWRVVNIGRGEPINLLAFISQIEAALDRKAVVELLPMQPGDLARTFADSSLLQALTGYRPTTSIETGVRSFCEWFRAYHS